MENHDNSVEDLRAVLDCPQIGHVVSVESIIKNAEEIISNAAIKLEAYRRTVAALRIENDKLRETVKALQNNS